MTSRICHFLGAATILGAFAFVPAATAGEVNTGYFGNVAIEGYDTVAYFTEHRAVKGSSKYSTEWLGAKWQFSSPENRALFQSSPMSYVPQFGGLCAEGVAFGELTVNLEPETFEIIDGKLYLTAGAAFEDMPGNVSKAEKTWPTVHAEMTQ